MCPKVRAVIRIALVTVVDSEVAIRIVAAIRAVRGMAGIAVASTGQGGGEMIAAKLLLDKKREGHALGSAEIREKFDKMTDNSREEVTESAKAVVMEMLKRTIRPEFLNRIDEIIMFSPLMRSEISKIVKMHIGSICKLLKEQDVELNVTDKAFEFITDEGYDPEFGARPVKRVLQRHLLNELSKQILSASIDRSKPIIVDSDGNGLTFRN